jgi:hypothetical protein
VEGNVDEQKREFAEESIIGESVMKAASHSVSATGIMLSWRSFAIFITGVC